MLVKSLESWGAFQSISTPTLCGKAFPKDSIVHRLLEAIPRLDAHRAGLAGNARRGAQRNAVEQRHVMDLVEQVGDEELDVQPRAQCAGPAHIRIDEAMPMDEGEDIDRKSTRLNSSH